MHLPVFPSDPGLCSDACDLFPGDIILTGTPFGVILGMKEQQWMQAGDEYVVEIGDLGRLVNRMVVSDPDW